MEQETMSEVAHDERTRSEAIDVTLTQDQCIYPASIGVRRKLSAIEKNRNCSWGKSVGDPWKEDIFGAVAEWIVAKWLKLPWKSFFENPSEAHGDVGGCEVRYTHYWNGHLRGNDHDKPDAPYILVVGEYPNFRIVGWAYGREVHQEKYFGSKQADGERPAYWMPQSDLRPLGDLKAMVDAGELK